MTDNKLINDTIQELFRVGIEKGIPSHEVLKKVDNYCAWLIDNKYI